MYDGLKPPFAFTRLRHGPFNKKKAKRCYLSRKPIQPGEPCYAFIFVDSGGMDEKVVSEAAAHASPEFMQCIVWHRDLLWPPEVLFAPDSVVFFRHDTDHLPTRHWENLDAALSLVDGPLTGIGPACDYLKIIGGWAMSALHPALLERYDTLSPALQVTLAFSDNPAFREKAYAVGLLPDWESIRKILMNGRHSLDDMLTLAHWGDAHPETLATLMEAERRYMLFSLRAYTSIGFYELRYGGHGPNFLHLFAARPALCPYLGDFDPENPLAAYDAWIHRTYPDIKEMNLSRIVSPYCKPHFYRTGLFVRLLAGQREEAVRAGCSNTASA